MATFIGALMIACIMAGGALGIGWMFIEAQEDYKLMVQYKDGKLDWVKMSKA